MKDFSRVHIAGNLVDFLGDILGYDAEDIRDIARYMDAHLEVKEREEQEEEEPPSLNQLYRLN